MKPGAFLVNTARGRVVDEAALVRALEAGAIGGAGLDVYQVEPLPLDHPLRRAPRTVLTAHAAHVTRQRHGESYGAAVERISDFLDGTPSGVIES